MAEQWRAIEGTNNMYEVSDHGRVRSWWSNYGKRRATPKVLRGMDRAGYRRVRLYADDGSWRDHSVHRLVLETFAPCPLVGQAPTSHGFIPRHKNDVRDDNRLENLEWGTQADNIRDRDVRGRRTAPKGERHPMAKLSPADVLAIRQRHAAGEGLELLGQSYGVTRHAIWRIVHGKTWRHL
jgi:hypothetical protein